MVSHLVNFVKAIHLSLSRKSILKVTNNPYKSCGKQFKNFDAAQENYKCAEMKMALLKIETNLI